MYESLLERIALALGESGIPYMVIGGQAVLLYGEPRLTRDIDVTVGAGLDRLDEVVAAAGRAGLVPLVDPRSFTVDTMVLPCQDPVMEVRVDFILSFSPYEADAIARARTVAIGAAEVRFASPEDLVVHKVVAGRPRDLEDVRGILLRNPALDRDRVRSVLAEFDSSLHGGFVERFERIGSAE